MIRLALAGLAATCGHATAATLDGVTLPDTFTVDGQSLALNGLGLRTMTILHIHAYVAGLYVAHPSHDAGQILASPDPKVLVLRYVHSGSKALVEKEYRQGETENCGNGECATSDRDDFERMIAAAPAVNPGDKSTFVFANNSVKVYANAEMIGNYTNTDLAYHVLDAFIGRHPPSEALRAGLLGLASD